VKGVLLTVLRTSRNYFLDWLLLEDKGTLFSETSRATHSMTLCTIPENLSLPCVNWLVCVVATQFVLRIVGTELLSHFIIPRTNCQLSTFSSLSWA